MRLGPVRLRPLLAWAPLALLLAALVVAAATLDRRSWPGFLGDEATYLLQAESLAWDQDLRYSREDHERFVRHWGRAPEGLILQSGDGGRTLAFGKPPYYALAIAPLVRLWPLRGAMVANALLLAAAALATALALRRSLGAVAPLAVAAFVFASVAFAYTFWAHADLFLMSLVALALALAFGGERSAGAPAAQIYSDETTEPRWRFLGRWAAAGALLAVVAVTRPFYGALLVAAALAVPRRRRAAGLAALGVGAVAVVLVAVALSQAVHGTWTSYGGERLGFYSYTGYPEVDFPADDWSDVVAERGTSGSWIEPGRIVPYGFNARLWAWNGLYLLAGRHVGILPYFLPVVLGLLAFRGGAARWALVVAALAAVLCFLAVRPFNFYGGGGAIANRYFLPVYAAFWFLPARRLRAAWVLAVVALAAPFLWPLWSRPTAFPLRPEGGFRYVSPLAQRWLPYETTMDHLKPAGREDLRHNGLWIKLLRPGMKAVDGGRWLTSPAGGDGELLMANPTPLAGVELDLQPPAPARLTVAGGETARTILHPDGGTSVEIRFTSPRARHPMWWTREDLYLYQLRLSPPDSEAGRPLRFRLVPLAGGALGATAP